MAGALVQVCSAPVGSTVSLLLRRTISRKHFPTRGIEARLYLACGAGVLFPVGMMIYAWSCFRSVHWVGLAIGITIFIWATYIIYLSVFTYLADWYVVTFTSLLDENMTLGSFTSYGPFASSALAGQSLARERSLQFTSPFKTD